MGNLKGKRLLVQGAGRGNLGIMKAAIRNGVYTIVTGLGGDYPCIPLANKNVYADISNPDDILAVAEREKIDGAIICCSDTGLKAIGRCNDILGLSGLTEESADVSSNKLLMKQRLIENNVRTAMFVKVSCEDDLRKADEELKYPLIVKATDLQGSRGITVVRDPSNLKEAFEDVMKLTKKDYCIVEEFITGREMGAQSFVYNGQVLFVLPHGDETFMAKTAVPIGHYMPYEISEDLRADIEIQARKSISALGFNNSAVNIDFIEKDGKVYVIELTGRVGANCLPELTSNYFGFDYYEMILRTALGESPIPIFESRKQPMATMSRMIQSRVSGVVKKIYVPDNLPGEVHLFVHEKSAVRAFTNSNDAVGEVIVKGLTLSECDEKLTNIINSILIEIEMA